MKKVKVTWFDAYSRDPWETPDEAKSLCKPKLTCKTIGWLLDADKNHITICHTNNPQMVMGSLHIPRGCIKKIKYLKLTYRKLRPVSRYLCRSSVEADF